MEGKDKNVYSDILRYVIDKYCNNDGRGTRRPLKKTVQTVPKPNVMDKDFIKSLHKKVSSINARLILNTHDKTHPSSSNSDYFRTIFDNNINLEKKVTETEKNH